MVAASGGNHGAAVAYAAMTLKIPARIFVPSVSSPAKIARIREYGADLVIEGDRYADALAASEAWVERSGAIPVHAFDQYETVLGQATIAQELATKPRISIRCLCPSEAAVLSLELPPGMGAQSR